MEYCSPYNVFEIETKIAQQGGKTEVGNYLARRSLRENNFGKQQMKK